MKARLPRRTVPMTCHLLMNCTIPFQRGHSVKPRRLPHGNRVDPQTRNCVFHLRHRNVLEHLRAVVVGHSRSRGHGRDQCLHDGHHVLLRHHYQSPGVRIEMAFIRCTACLRMTASAIDVQNEGLKRLGQTTAAPTAAILTCAPHATGSSR